MLNQALMSREVPVSKTIPYSEHVSPHVLTTHGLELVTCFRLAGVAHESADDDDLDLWLARLNNLLHTISNPRLALWTHTVRQERSAFPGGNFTPGSFSAQLNDRYEHDVGRNRMMVNELYVSLVYSPAGNKAEALWKRFERLSAADVRAGLEEDLETIEDLAETIAKGLQEYLPTRLGTYEADGVVCSEAMEFFGFLVNGYWERIPVPRLLPGQDHNVAEALPSARPFFGKEAYELRGPTESNFGAILALKSYPPLTAAGFINKLLSLPFEFVLSQSFRFIPQEPALRLLQKQHDKMEQSGDKAVSQIAELGDLMDAVASGRESMGEHHFALNVRGKSMGELKDNLQLAQTNLSDCFCRPVREDLGLESAFWSQLPGNYRYRTRPAPITGSNFASFASMHNYPSGYIAGNQWGPAVTMFKTASGTPFYFNFHVGKPSKQQAEAGADSLDSDPNSWKPGNTLIIGPTGSGKTVNQTFLLAQAEKFKPTVFYYDKDRGMEIFFRAMGGSYLVIRNSVPTGFNPFRRPHTPALETYLGELVRMLVRGGRDEPLKASQEAEIDKAIAGVLGMEPESRRLMGLLEFVDKTDKEGVGARLMRWCHDPKGHSHGPLAWVFDNEHDVIDVTRTRLNGFDVTDLLDNDQIREPVLSYLLFRQEEVLDGRRFILGFDEGWKILYDPSLSKYLENKELVIRKQNGVVIFGTQNPSHVIKSSIADTLVQQSVTQIYLPNPKASREDYIDGFKLSEREYQIIHDEMPSMQGHPFLVKQGPRSAICLLDLSGFDDELAVLSSTTATVELLAQILPETGHDPAAWLPEFHQRRSELK